MVKIILCIAVFMCGHLFAMDPDISAFLSSEEHLNEVKALGDSKIKRVLILGANINWGVDRFSSDCFFLDNGHPASKDLRAIAADFNNLNDLAVLGNKFSAFFDDIILDGSTFHHTDWSVGHISYFKGMLKPNGVFIIAPYIGNVRIVINKNATIDDVWRVAKESCKANMEARKLCSSMRMLYPFPTQHLADVTDKVEAEKQFRAQFLVEYMVPGNYSPIIESVFGQGNVAVESNGNLPFRSGEPETVVFRAIKR